MASDHRSNQCRLFYLGLIGIFKTGYSVCLKCQRQVGIAIYSSILAIRVTLGNWGLVLLTERFWENCRLRWKKAFERAERSFSMPLIAIWSMVQQCIPGQCTALIRSWHTWSSWLKWPREKMCLLWIVVSFMICINNRQLEEIIESTNHSGWIFSCLEWSPNLFQGTTNQQGVSSAISVSSYIYIHGALNFHYCKSRPLKLFYCLYLRNAFDL